MKGPGDRLSLPAIGGAADTAAAIDRPIEDRTEDRIEVGTTEDQSAGMKAQNGAWSGARIVVKSVATIVECPAAVPALQTVDPIVGQHAATTEVLVEVQIVEDLWTGGIVDPAGGRRVVVRQWSAVRAEGLIADQLRIEVQVEARRGIPHTIGRGVQNMMMTRIKT